MYLGCPLFNSPCVRGLVRGEHFPLHMLSWWEMKGSLSSSIGSQGQKHILIRKLELEARDAKKKRSWKCLWCHAAGMVSEASVNPGSMQHRSDDLQGKATSDGRTCGPGQVAIAAWLPDTLQILSVCQTYFFKLPWIIKCLLCQGSCALLLTSRESGWYTCEPSLTTASSFSVAPA